jgi:hypothetical protein
MKATRPQAVEIIRSLIDRIEVRPGQERGHCGVIIVGALAQILETIEIAGDDFVNRQAPG